MPACNDLLMWPASPVCGLDRVPVIVEVEPIRVLDEEAEVSVKTKELWDSLERFRNADHRVNGWVINVGLSRSLRKLSDKDAQVLQSFPLGASERL